MDFEKEKAIHAALLGAIRKGLVRSAHDCSEGGLAVAIAESTFGTGLGASIDLGATTERPDIVLFNETQGRILLTTRSADASALERTRRQWRPLPQDRRGDGKAGVDHQDGSEFPQMESGGS